MARKKLSATYSLCTLAALLGITLLSGCQADNGAVGLSLSYRCEEKKESIGVSKVVFEGAQGSVEPGGLGCDGAHNSKEMSFMPTDLNGKMPRWVDVTWTVPSAQSNAEWKQLSERSDKYSPQWTKDYEAYEAKIYRRSKRIGLTPIITPSLLSEVRADRKNTQLKLIFTFKDEQVKVTAEASKWR